MGEGTSNSSAIAQAQAEWNAAAPELQKQFQALLAQAQAQLSYAKDQQARWAKEMRALQAFKDDPSQPENNTYVSVALLHEAYVAMQQMGEIEVAAHTHNLAIVSPGGTITNSPQVPSTSGGYLEQRRRMVLAISRYLVRYNIQGIDTVLRATSKGRSITPVSDEQMHERLEAARALTASAERSESLKGILDKLSDELQTVRQFNKRMMAAFEGWDRLDAGGRKAIVDDPAWERMDELVMLMQQLYERTATFPALQALFVPWKQEKLPFAATRPPQAITAPAAKGPDKLEVGSATGKPATIRLQ